MMWNADQGNDDRDWTSSWRKNSSEKHKGDVKKDLALSAGL